MDKSFSQLFHYMTQYVELNETNRTFLISKIKHRSYAKGEFVVQAGNICMSSSFILKGAIRTYYLDKNGKEHTISLAIENWWTGDLHSFLTQTPANYHVQCVEKTELIQFSYQNMEILYQELPQFERLFRIIIQKAYIATKQRLIDNRSLIAKERYLKFKATYPQLEERFPQYMITSYLGISKEFLSKIRAEIKID